MNLRAIKDGLLWTLGTLGLGFSVCVLSVVVFVILGMIGMVVRNAIVATPKEILWTSASLAFVFALGIVIRVLIWFSDKRCITR